MMISTMRNRSLRFGRYSIFQCARRSLWVEYEASGQSRLDRLEGDDQVRAVDAHEEGGVRAKDCARRADARQADEGKVGAEDEAEEARRKVDDEEARRAHHALDLRRVEERGQARPQPET